MILCLDVGNTSLHWGLVEGERILQQGNLPTRLIAQGFPFHEISSERAGLIVGVVWCSVVPEVNPILVKLMEERYPEIPVRGLHHQGKLGIGIHYPRPQEIGQDRLANAVGAKELYGLPAIVIDMGTATTFDIVTKQGGYEGGIIAPGMALMTRYLHEQTALLPQLEAEDLVGGPVIGRSTREAMRSGCLIGFTGMIRSLLEAVREAMQELGETATPQIVLTGGNAGDLWAKQLPEFTWNPDLTLLGLAKYFERNR